MERVEFASEEGWGYGYAPDDIVLGDAIREAVSKKIENNVAAFYLATLVIRYPGTRRGALPGFSKPLFCGTDMQTGTKKLHGRWFFMVFALAFSMAAAGELAQAGTVMKV